ncbi:hypothetical protein AGLY_005129 [Aphis glycines]|uniref:Uncharacterized protein n=1 Tax=Aphis glycines TaxID=307491 RepID=A0A6G0TWR7_APHGL|nr:hypothetical protein AGLY_005129 [Aphis glycines]
MYSSIGVKPGQYVNNIMYKVVVYRRETTVCHKHFERNENEIKNEYTFNYNNNPIIHPKTLITRGFRVTNETIYNVDRCRRKRTNGLFCKYSISFVVGWLIETIVLLLLLLLIIVMMMLLLLLLVVTDRSSSSTARFREPKSECLSGKRQRVTTGKKRIIVKKIVHDPNVINNNNQRRMAAAAADNDDDDDDAQTE